MKVIRVCGADGFEYICEELSRKLSSHAVLFDGLESGKESLFRWEAEKKTSVRERLGEADWRRIDPLLEVEFSACFIDPDSINNFDILQRLCDGADIAIFISESAIPVDREISIERVLKEKFGVKKVLIVREEEELKRAIEKVVTLIYAKGGKMDEEIPEELIQAIRQGSSEGRITCEKAHEIAKELNLPLPLVGKALDMLGVKITKCQLGCF